MFGAEEIGAETAEIAFLSETQYMKDFLNLTDVETVVRMAHIYFSCLEEVLQSEVVPSNWTCQQSREPLAPL